jgi:hypothetical protein
MAPVTVALAAADNPGGSGVKQISYSAAGAQTTPITNVAGGSASFTIEAEGVTTVTYFARDHAGNEERPKTLPIKVDKSPPQVGCTATPSTIWPPNKQMSPVTVDVLADDPHSGPVAVRLTSVETTEGTAQAEAQDWMVGTDDRHGQVRADRNASGPGRTYTLTYSGANQAGLTATCVATVLVPHDRGDGAVHIRRDPSPPPGGPGTSSEPALQATVAAREGCGPLSRIQAGTVGRPLGNAVVTITTPAGGPGDQVRGFVYEPPPGTIEVSFTIRRVAPNGSATVSPLIVTDACGERPTFVGGGPDAFP